MVEYPYGTDMEWLAVDRDGRVAVFTTAGAGPVPVSVLEFERGNEAGVELTRRELERPSPQFFGHI